MQLSTKNIGMRDYVFPVYRNGFLRLGSQGSCVGLSLVPCCPTRRVVVILRFRAYALSNVQNDIEIKAHLI